MGQDVVAACLSLMRRMPPNDIDNNLSGLVGLVPDAAEELLQRVDQPLEGALDAGTGREFLKCEYNRDGDSYRSPWSNQYLPPLDDGYTPPDTLRKLEVDANELFDAYRELYYEGGVSSVYLWDLGDGGVARGGFAGCFLVKKEVSAPGGKGGVSSWEATHVVQVKPEGAKSAVYALNTTVMIAIQPSQGQSGSISLSGNLTRAAEETKSFKTDDDHLVNIGRMIEDMETSVRRDIDGLYVQKTRQILSAVRSGAGAGPQQGTQFTSQLNAAIGLHGARRDSGTPAIPSR